MYDDKAYWFRFRLWQETWEWWKQWKLLHHVCVWAAHASSGLLLIHAGCEAHLPAIARWSGWKSGSSESSSHYGASHCCMLLIHQLGGRAAIMRRSQTHTHTRRIKAPRGSLISEPDSQTESVCLCVCVCVCVRTRGGEFFRVISISALREERKVNNSNQESSNRWIHAEKSRLVIPFALSFVERKKGVFTEVADPKKTLSLFIHPQVVPNSKDFPF